MLRGGLSGAPPVLQHGDIDGLQKSFRVGLFLVELVSAEFVPVGLFHVGFIPVGLVPVGVVPVDRQALIAFTGCLRVTAATALQYRLTDLRARLLKVKDSVSFIGRVQRERAVRGRRGRLGNGLRGEGPGLVDAGVEVVRGRGVCLVQLGAAPVRGGARATRRGGWAPRWGSRAPSWGGRAPL